MFLEFFRNIFDAFLFVAFRLARFSRYILSILVAIQMFAARSVNSLTKYFTSQLVRWTLKEQHLIYLIRILESTMNGPQNPLPSEQVLYWVATKCVKGPLFFYGQPGPQKTTAPAQDWKLIYILPSLYIYEIILYSCRKSV